MHTTLGEQEAQVDTWDAILNVIAKAQNLVRYYDTVENGPLVDALGEALEELPEDALDPAPTLQSIADESFIERYTIELKAWIRQQARACAHEWEVCALDDRQLAYCPKCLTYNSMPYRWDLDHDQPIYKALSPVDSTRRASFDRAFLAHVYDQCRLVARALAVRAEHA